MFLIMGLAAGAITVVARLVAPSAIAEAGLYAAVLALPTGLTFLFGVPSTPTLALIGFFALGVVWAALALTTRMLTVPTLGAVLGLLTALMTALGDTAVSKWLALALAVGGFAAYVKLPRWPLVAAAMLGAVVLTFEVVGSATNGAVALLVAGLLLLVLATLGFFFGRRRGHAS